MFKKIAIIVLFLGVTAGMAYLIYRFFFGAPAVTTPTPSGGQTQGGGSLPTAGNGRPTTGGAAGTAGLPTSAGTPAGTPPTPAQQGPGSTYTVAATEVMSPHPLPGGNMGFYDIHSGQFFQVLPDGTTHAMSSQTFPQAQSVTWAPNGGKALITFPDDSKIIYDFAAQKQVTLPKHWQDVTFNGDGSMIVAKSMGLDAQSRWLVSAASDGTSEKLIEPLGDNGDKVTVSVSPDSSVIAFSDTSDPVGFDAKDLLVIGQNHENNPALRVEGFGFDPVWSSNGSNLLYSVSGQTSNYQPNLWLVDGSGGTVGDNRRNLDIQTWADKCVFQGTTSLYCAVPQNLPEGAGLERDIANTLTDSVVKVDLSSGTVTTIGQPAQDTSINSPVLSSDGSKLFFVASDGSLQTMNLR